MIAPIDFVVPEGDTGLPPGPALSDLKKVGIKAQVKGATIFVPKDTVIAKAGDIVSADIVSTLSKLDIKPIELILDVPLVKEDNLIYLKDVLDIDSEKVYYDIISAIRAGINLSVELTYPTEETINLIIGMAHLKALALEREVNKE